MSGFDETGVASPAVLAPSVELAGLLVGGGAPVLAYGVIRWVVPPPAGSGATSSAAALVVALVVVAGLVVATFPAAGRGPRWRSVRRGVLSGTAVVVAAAIGPLAGWWPGWVGYAVFGSEMVVMDVHSVLARARRWRLGRAQLVDGRGYEPGVVWLLERRRLVVAAAVAVVAALQTTIWFTDRHPDVSVFTFTTAICAAAIVWVYRRAAGPLWGYVASETAPLGWRRRRPTTGAELAAAAYRRVGIGWAADPVTQHRQGLAATVPADDLRPGDVVFWRAEPDGDGRPVHRSALYAGTSGYRGAGALCDSGDRGRRDRLVVDVVDGRARLVPLPEHDLVGAVRPVAAGGVR